MRRVFFVSAVLMALVFAVVWCAQHLAPSEPSASFDSETTVTVLQGGAVRTVPLSEWLWGVLAAEMPASFEPEALRAQAVAARTYVLDHMQKRPSAHPNADVCDDPGCCTAWRAESDMAQTWGAEAEQFRARIAAAVADTDGEILTYAGAPIRAVFHASSAGRTESSAALWGERPYLVSVSSPETAEDVPNYVTVTEVSADAVREAVMAACPDCVLPEDPAQWFGAPTLDASGRVETQTLGSSVFTGAELRKLFNLRSASFAVAYADGVFTFTTTGAGHGVGMSQYGANVMAKQGSTYVEILMHYYPGTTLCKPNEA